MVSLRKVAGKGNTVQGLSDQSNIGKTGPGKVETKINGIKKIKDLTKQMLMKKVEKRKTEPY